MRPRRSTEADLSERSSRPTRTTPFYAPTPPLEALRYIISDAATLRKHENKVNRAKRQLMINDVARAYFYAPCTRDVYIELPPEDDAGPHVIGKLNLSLYGTRDAAANWQETLAGHLVGLGFVRSKAYPCIFVHKSRDMLTLVHGDDYVTSGEKEHLDWMQAELEKAYEIKSERIGPSANHEGKVLNRIIGFDGNQWLLEADPRHSELIVEQLGLAQTRAVSTAGADEKEDEAEELIELEGNDIRLFRGVAARCNYLSMDRPDIMFASKEVCRDMSKPTIASLKRLKRIGRFLKGRPRLVWKFIYQHKPDTLVVNSDANWAGCKRSRKSTSGGTAMWGRHCLKAWTKTQQTVATSSAESELYGIIRASCEALGLQSLIEGFNTQAVVRIQVDAAAAKSIVERKGLSKVRHIDTAVLWLQEQQVRRMLPLVKVQGTMNEADMMTKNLDVAQVEGYLSMLELEYGSGRSTAAAQLHSIKKAKMSLAKDYWDCRGQGGLWRRRHSMWRTELFTPNRIPRGPSRGTQIACCRRTEGVYRDGSQFVVVDDWTGPNKHARLPKEWNGVTTFIGCPNARSAEFMDCCNLLTVAPESPVEDEVKEESAPGHAHRRYE